MPLASELRNKMRIGTSGYSFADWQGPFYPAGLEKSQWLEYYSRFFNCVEVNSTYYRIPHPRVFSHMAEKTPPGFEFVVKVHQETTHARRENATACKQLLESVAALRECGKLSGFLAQFPYSFKNSQPSRGYLAATRQLLGDDPLFVEFRHSSWLQPEIEAFLRQQQIGYVCVDEPSLPGLLPPQRVVTTDTGYVRFHGRNAQNWWDTTQGDRYDYDYSSEELTDWQERIAAILPEVKKLYLFFNNCHHGRAPQNALQMRVILNG